MYTERGIRHNAARQKTEAMKEKIDRLESFVSLLQTSTPDTGQQSHRAVPSEACAGDPDNALHLLSEATGNVRLQSDSGSTRYVGPANWESIIEDVSVLPTACCQTMLSMK